MTINPDMTGILQKMWKLLQKGAVCLLFNQKLITGDTLFVGAIIAAVALSLAAIKLLPSLEFTKMSSRSSGVSFEEFLGHPVDLKDAFGTFVTNIGFAGISAAAGVFGLVLLVFGLFDYRKKLVIFSAVLIIFSMLFASGTFIADWMYRIPGFGKLRHVERALVLFSFAASVLAAYGFVVLSQKLKKFITSWVFVIEIKA